MKMLIASTFLLGIFAAAAATNNEQTSRMRPCKSDADCPSWLKCRTLFDGTITVCLIPPRGVEKVGAGGMNLLSMLGGLSNSGTLSEVLKVMQMLNQIHQTGAEVQSIVPQVQELLGDASQEVKDFINSVASAFGFKPVLPSGSAQPRILLPCNTDEDCAGWPATTCQSLPNFPASFGTVCLPRPNDGEKAGAMNLLSMLGGLSNSGTLSEVLKVMQLLNQIHQTGAAVQSVAPQVQELLGDASQEVKDFINSVASGFGFKPVLPSSSGSKRASKGKCTQELESAAVGMVGSYRPQCDADGSYAATQCHGSTGYCWCVTKEGEHIGEARPPGTLRGCKCAREQHQALSSGVTSAHVPRCEANGEYSPVQCNTYGLCWCADALGNHLTKPVHGPHVTC